MSDHVSTMERAERRRFHNNSKTYYQKAMKIARPVVNRVAEAGADHYGSDCPMAGRMIQHGLAQKGDAPPAEHPITLLRRAYGI